MATTKRKRVSVNPAELLAPGTVLGPYVVERVLGAGAFGVVYAVRKGALRKQKAIKVLLRHWNGDARITARFQREARALVDLHDENIVQVEDLGVVDGLHYFEMEYLEGRPLSAALKERPRWTLTEALDVVLPVASGLHAAHASPMRLVHRDLKPDNIFLVASGGQRVTPKVIDFGVAHASEDVEEMTQTGQVIGTRSYMSPEQVNSSREIDGRADQWALAVVLFRMLTGRLPFYVKDNPFQTQLRITDGPTPRLREHDVSVDPAAERALRKALEKGAADRFPSMREFGLALAPFARQETRARFEAAMARAPDAEETVPAPPHRPPPPRLETAPTQPAALPGSAQVVAPPIDAPRAAEPTRATTTTPAAPAAPRDPAEAVTVPKIAVPPPETPRRRFAETRPIDELPKPPLEFAGVLAAPIAPPAASPVVEPTELLSDAAVERTPLHGERMRSASKVLLAAAALVLVAAGVVAVWPDGRSAARDAAPTATRDAGAETPREVAVGVSQRLQALLGADASGPDDAGDATASGAPDARTDSGVRAVAVVRAPQPPRADAGVAGRPSSARLMPNPYGGATSEGADGGGSRPAPAEAPRVSPTSATEAPAPSVAATPQECVVFRNGLPVVEPCGRGGATGP